MKRHYLSILLLFLFFFFNACEDDLDLDAEYKDITIVYGLMEKTDQGESDTTFIKITKAFLGGNAYQNALIPDSSEYQEKLYVELQKFDDSGIPTGNTYVFDTTTIHNKDTLSGDFYCPYQQMYYCIMPVNEDFIYKLKIIYNNKEITSETCIVNNFSITKPGYSKWINYIPDKNLDFNWEMSANSASYEALIRFYFTEIWVDSQPGDSVHRYIDWIKAKTTPITIIVGNEESVTYATNIFYSAIKNLAPYPDQEKENKVLRRYSGKVEYFVYAAGETLTTYIDVNGPSGNIIQERPEYTNINNGYGIFSSRLSQSKSKILHTDTKMLIKDLGVKFEY